MQGTGHYKNEHERTEALGSFVNPREGRFYGNIGQFWGTMKRPEPGDWLFSNVEQG